MDQRGLDEQPTHCVSAASCNVIVRNIRKKYGFSPAFADIFCITQYDKAETAWYGTGNAVKNSCIFAVSADILVMKEAAEMVNFFLMNGAAFSGESNGLLFSVVNGEATVTGCTGEPERVVIPDFFGCYPVTELRDNAFCNCDSLTEIIISQNVRKIGHHCFYACSALERAELPAELGEIGADCFCGCTDLESIELPETLRSLPESCFRACLSLEELDLPGGLESIGELCFSDCENMKSMDVGGNIRSIGSGAFFMCRNLSSIRVPSSCEVIGAQALGYDCNGNELIKNEKLVIIGEKGSAAQKYARENGFDFSVQGEAAEAFAAVTSERKRLSDYQGFLLSGAVVLAAFSAVVIRCFILHKRR